MKNHVFISDGFQLSKTSGFGDPSYPVGAVSNCIGVRLNREYPEFSMTINKLLGFATLYPTYESEMPSFR